MTARRRTLVLAMVVSLAAAGAAVPSLVAQGTPGLAEVETRIDDGRIESARDAISRWWEEAADTAGAATRARALYLQALLTDSTDIALRGYLRVSLEHPSHTMAEDALLRLGQAHFAAGDLDAARSHLERFLRDYPESGYRPHGEYWLARTRIRAGDAEGGCRILREMRGSADPALRQDARETIEERCTASAEEPRPAGVARFTVQIGAHRAAESAVMLRDRARTAGFDATLVRVGGDKITRVRVGEFATRAQADVEAGRLAAAGFETAIVRIEEG